MRTKARMKRKIRPRECSTARAMLIKLAVSTGIVGSVVALSVATAAVLVASNWGRTPIGWGNAILMGMLKVAEWAWGACCGDGELARIKSRVLGASEVLYPVVSGFDPDWEVQASMAFEDTRRRSSYASKNELLEYLYWNMYVARPKSIAASS